MDLLIKWGNERISVPFPDGSFKLGKLKEELSEKTGIPIGQFKLVHAGAVMKDNNAPLSAYGLKPGSKLTLIGTAAPLPTTKEPPVSKPSLPKTQDAVLATIKSELENVHSKIAPNLDTFLHAVSPPTATVEEDSTPALATPQSNPADLQQEHTRLGELLLQALLRLDAITPESEWEEARKARKAAVKEVQGMLERLDAGWKNAKLTGVEKVGNGEGNGHAAAAGSSGKKKRRR